jgi:hypothetical protein
MSSTGRFCHNSLTSAIWRELLRTKCVGLPAVLDGVLGLCKTTRLSGPSGESYTSDRPAVEDSPRLGQGGDEEWWEDMEDRGVIGRLSLTLPKRGVGQSVVSGYPTSPVYISPVVLLCVDAVDDTGFSNNNILELQHSKIFRYRTYASPLSVTSRDRSAD